MFIMLRFWLWGWSWIVTSLIKSWAILHLSFLCRQLPSLAQDTHKQFPPQQVICHRHQNYHCGHHHHFDQQQDNQLSPDNFPHHFQSNHTPLKLDLDDNHSSEEELEDIIGTKKVTLNFFIFSFLLCLLFSWFSHRNMFLTVRVLSFYWSTGPCFWHSWSSRS